MPNPECSTLGSSRPPCIEILTPASSTNGGYWSWFTNISMSRPTNHVNKGNMLDKIIVSLYQCHNFILLEAGGFLIGNLSSNLTNIKRCHLNLKGCVICTIWTFSTYIFHAWHVIIPNALTRKSTFFTWVTQREPWTMWNRVMQITTTITGENPLSGKLKIRCSVKWGNRFLSVSMQTEHWHGLVLLLLCSVYTFDMHGVSCSKCSLNFEAFD